MPKMKPRKGAKKRFRVTATGKLKRPRAGKSKLLSHKTGRRKAHLRRPEAMNDKVAKKLVRMMGGHA